MFDSFSRPGGNATGMYVLVNVLVAKQLEVLREVVPGATTVAFIDNPTNPFSELRLREIQETALALGPKLKLIKPDDPHASLPRGGRLWQRSRIQQRREDGRDTWCLHPKLPRLLRRSSGSKSATC